MNDLKSFFIITLGCRVNQYESQYYTERLEALGYTKADNMDDASVYILNTCSVTGESDKKSRSYISRMIRKADEMLEKKGYRPVIAVTGCHAQGSSETNELLGKCDIVCGNENKDRIPDMIDGLLRGADECSVRDVTEIKYASGYREMGISKSELVKAYIKIEDGCAGFCTYCIVPYLRGRPRSRDEKDILEEVKRLAVNGYTEIVFTGIEVGDYGRDSETSMPLLRLAEKAALTEGIKRIRFGSLNPKLVTKEFMSGLAKIPQVMPHFHLSLQSGSDRVLSAMKRRYTRRDEEAAVNAVYEAYGDGCISADIICGFPGETEEEFLDSVSLAKKAMLMHAHVFPYSKRAGTPAASMSGQIPSDEKKRRCAFLASEAEKARDKRLSMLYGKEFSVLAEISHNGLLYGHTENFIYVCAGAGSSHDVGKYIPVRLDEETVRMGSEARNG
ncbi:MAG: tRNA (N(6)-L-threonylcarbamoyladenosine(37)-C(2))-methylthiotransferase MtaB [Ruminococcaceae bacterium]|nr:tRNA (N(6)-L-threonylcarbamoyladenosine(37)-C(2))-methylthiotransferase MtaB [Oscillospiraceae bacterium]